MRRAPVGCFTAGVLCFAAWPTPAEATVRCVVRRHVIPGIAHSRVESASRDVVIYRTRGVSADGFWACSRRGNRFVLVGRDDFYQSAESEYGPTTTWSAFQVAGDWLIAIHETGADAANACGKYRAFPCPGAEDTLVIVDVARGLRAHLASIETDRTDASGKTLPVVWSQILLSPRGAVAWLQTGGTETPLSSPPLGESTSSLYGCRVTIKKGTIGCTKRLLGHGDIDAASVRLVATTLSWTASGQLHSALLE